MHSSHAFTLFGFTSYWPPPAPPRLCPSPTITHSTAWHATFHGPHSSLPFVEPWTSPIGGARWCGPYRCHGDDPWRCGGSPATRGIILIQAHAYTGPLWILLPISPRRSVATAGGLLHVSSTQGCDPVHFLPGICLGGSEDSAFRRSSSLLMRKFEVVELC